MVRVLKPRRFLAQLSLTLTLVLGALAAFDKLNCSGRPERCRRAATAAEAQEGEQGSRAPVSPALGAVAFTGPELVTVEGGAPAVAVGDVNGDGLLDLVAINPAKACIDCLLQRSPAEMAEAEAEAGSRLSSLAGGPVSVEDEDVNRLPDAARFERRPLQVEKLVFSVVVADFTGDGRDDLAYYGEPRELVVVAQTDEGTWGERQTFDITDGSRNAGGLAAADLNGDGHTDLALLARQAIHILYGGKDGTFGAPQEVPTSADAASFLLVGDYDGDGRLDLAYPVANQDHPLCFRLQTSDGRLGPERFAELPAFRAAAGSSRADDPRTTLATVLSVSGRVQLARLVPRPAREGGTDASLLLYPLEEDSVERQYLVTDVDGDGRTDVVATYPSTAQTAVLFQRPDGGLEPPRLYPSLGGVTALAVGDLDGDGGVELVMLSKEEEAIGYCSYEPADAGASQSSEGQGRLGFPRTVPFEGRPLAVAVGDVDGDGRDELLYVRAEEKKYHVVSRGVEETGELSEEVAVELGGLETDVSGLLAADLNHDGHLDVLAFVSFGPARLLLNDGEGSLRDTSDDPDVTRSLLRRLSSTNVNTGDVDGDGTAELLVAEKNFARAVSVDARGSPQVLDQANGRSPRSQIASATVADLDGDGQVEVVLLDNWAKELTVLTRQEDGTLGRPRSVSLAGVTFSKVLTGELTGDEWPDLLVLARNRVGVVPGRGVGWTFELGAGYESETERAYLSDLVAGDLTGDGSDELLLLDTSNHNLELLDLADDSVLKRFCRFQVFEKKVFRGRRQDSREPHQALLADLTGDGRTDIALLVHDRIVLYPQASAKRLTKGASGGGSGPLE